MIRPGSDRPVLMSRTGLALSAMITASAAFSLLSGVLYVGCSSAARPARFGPGSAEVAQPSPGQTSASPVPSSPSDPAAPTTATPQAALLPSQPVVQTELAVPVSVQGLSVGEVLGMTDAEALAELALTPSAAPQVRYTALRRLEEVDGERSVEVALALLDDPAPLVQTNAIAVLVRSGDPRADAALSGMDPRSQRIAAALAQQG